MLRRNIEELSNFFTNEYQKMQQQMLINQVEVSLPDYNYSRRFDNNLQQFVYYKIVGYSADWNLDTETTKAPFETMKSALVGLAAASAPISVIFKGEKNRISVYIGTHNTEYQMLRKVIESNFNNVRFEHNGDKFNANNLAYYDLNKIVNGKEYGYGGYIKGNPGIPEEPDFTAGISKVVNGMYDSDWIIAINAVPQSKAETLNRLNVWLSTATDSSVLLNVNYNDNDVKESTSHQQKYHFVEEYYKKVESFCEKTNEAMECGEWLTTISYGALTEKEANIVSSLFVSSFYGDVSEPEPLHAIKNTSLYGFAPVLNPAMDPANVNMAINSKAPYYKFSSLLSSRELSYFSMLPTKDTFGFSVDDYVEFDLSQEYDGNVTIGNIFNDGRLTDNEYKIDVNAFNRHCLVIGLTGGGKTNTIKSLFNSVVELSNDLPFMIIEPAKREYWELYKCGFDNLQVYSIGASEKNGNTYCLNPFERIGAIPIQTHIDYVFAAFKASFIMYTPMPYVLETAIYEIYEDCGWDIMNDSNPNGEVYPTIEDLYNKIPTVVTDMGYDSKMRNDLIGSLQARINSLRIGNKGRIFNVKKSFDIEKILQGRVVMELEDIGDDDVKAFIISLLLIQLSEYRKQQTDAQTMIRHMLLIEEAHRLLKNVQSGTGESADPRGAAVEFFCNLLAELRSKGQGFIIADQIPSKLAPDVIKNTNIKILHRTVDEDERLLMGGAMHMTDEQKEQISAFGQGVAAVYSEGDFRPKLIRTRYAGIFERPERKSITREQVIAITKSNCMISDEYNHVGKRNYCCVKCDGSCNKNYRDILNFINPTSYQDLLEILTAHKKKSPYKVADFRIDIEDFVKQYIPSETDFNKSVNCLVACVLDDWDANEKSKTIIKTKFDFKGE